MDAAQDSNAATIRALLDERMSVLRVRLTSQEAARACLVALEQDSFISDADKKLAGWLVSYVEGDDPDGSADENMLLDKFKEQLEKRLGRSICEPECGTYFEVGLACYRAGTAFQKALQL